MNVFSKKSFLVAMFACISLVTNSLVFCNSFTVLEVLFCREIKLLELNVIYLVLASTNPDFIFSYANSFSVEAFTFVKLFFTPQISYNNKNFTLE